MNDVTHVFDEAIATTPGPAEDEVVARTHPAYANMVGPYGGITAATVLAALQHHPDAAGEPLALTVNFAAPIADGEWTLRTRVVRTNRTNQHWTFEVSQGDGVTTTGSAVFGVHRDTWHDVEAVPPVAPPPESVPETQFPPAFAWPRNYEKRFVAGGLGEPAADDSTTTMWIRDAPERPLDHAALVSMSDAFFPRVFLRRGEFFPAGTITLTTYFHASSAELAAHGTGHVLATARGSRFAGGHFDQHGRLWGGSSLLATTHQLVYFKG